MSLMVDQTWRDQAGSPDRFGYEWGAYGDLLPEYEEQFRGWTVHLERADWRGLSFLDVGCGMGRNSYWPMSYGAREGVAVDIDERSLANRSEERRVGKGCRCRGVACRVKEKW